MKTLASLRKARTGLAGQRWLIYGEAKIGKSTFASEAPGNPLFLDCEYGLGFLDAYVINCSTWTEISTAIDSIAKGGHDHKTIVIDTVDRFVALATEHVQMILGIEHIGDAGFGKGYGRLRELLDAALFKLASSGRLVLLISHDRVIAEEGKPEKIRPSVSRVQQILGYCDVIGHVELDDNGERRIRFRATASVTAGARGRGGEPMLPAVLPLSWDAIRAHLKADASKPTPSKTSPSTTKEATQ